MPVRHQGMILGFIAAAAAVAGLMACAHVEAPPGGPVDKIPPYVIGAYPAPSATSVERDIAVRLQFSEWVKADGLQGQVILSPALPGKVRIKHEGDQILVDPDSLLRANTTYRLVVPAQIKDMNGVALDSAFELIFSTGKTLDSGVITGRVFQETGGAHVGAIRQAWAALYAESRETVLPRRGERKKSPWPDSTVNAWREKPTYLTPIDTSGRFRFEALPPGRYGVLAFVDANQNQLPDNGEAMAVGPAALRIGNVTPPFLSLKLGAQDTQKLRLAKVMWSPADAARDGKVAGALKVQFNRSLLSPKSRGVGAFTVWPAQDGPHAALRLQPLAISLGPEGDFELWFTDLPAKERVTLRVQGLSDDQGFPLDTARASLSFDALALGDSAALAAQGAAGGGLTVWRKAPMSGQPLPLFKEALAPPPEILVRSAMPLTDSLLKVLSARLHVRADSVSLSHSVRREGPFGMALSLPAIPVSAKSLYFGLKPASAQASGGKAVAAKADSVKPDTAKPSPEQPLGKWLCLAPDQPAHLRLQPEPAWVGWTALLNRQGSQDMRTFRFEGNREIKIDSLAPGIWRLWVFADQDGNGIWHMGSLKPWRSQEPAAAWPDTLSLKAGEGLGPVKVGGVGF